MQQTEKLGLKLPGPEDDLSPEPFNENARIIDGLLAEKGTCTVYTEAYKGDGTADRAFELGFEPKLVILMGDHANSGGVHLLTKEKVFCINHEGAYSGSGARLTENGFRITSSTTYNTKGATEVYIAFR